MEVFLLELNKFMKHIEESGALETGRNSRELCDFISNHVDLNTIRQWLSDIVHKHPADKLSNLASLMEIHPLGFEKYVLWDSSAGQRARLHYWPQNKWPFESIHDHRFNFYAIVIKGHYIHEEYDINQRKDSDEVEITLTRKQIVDTGQCYYFQAGTFHRIIPSDEETISLIIRSSPLLPYSRVVNPETLKMKRAYGAVKKFKEKIKELESVI